VTDSGEHSNEEPGSIKGREFLKWLSDLSASEEGLCSVESVIDLMYLSPDALILLSFVHTPSPFVPMQFYWPLKALPCSFSCVCLCT
jgi:hypothetical protein